jgi:hypothetical protein
MHSAYLSVRASDQAEFDEPESGVVVVEPSLATPGPDAMPQAAKSSVTAVSAMVAAVVGGVRWMRSCWYVGNSGCTSVTARSAVEPRIGLLKFGFGEDRRSRRRGIARNLV